MTRIYRPYVTRKFVFCSLLIVLVLVTWLLVHLLFYSRILPWGLGDPNKNFRVVIGAETQSADLVLTWSSDHPWIYLLDLKGAVIKKIDLSDVTGFHRHKYKQIMHVEPLNDGNLLVVHKDIALLKVSTDGELIWRRRGKFHHDAIEDRCGKIYALFRGQRLLHNGGVDHMVVGESIRILSSDGDVINTHDVLPAVLPFFSEEYLEESLRPVKMEDGEIRAYKSGKAADIVHANSIALVPGKNERCELQDTEVLLSMREPGLLAIYSFSDSKLAWSMRRTYGQHSADYVTSDVIRVLDNRPDKGASMIKTYSVGDKQELSSFGYSHSRWNKILFAYMRLRAPLEWFTGGWNLTNFFYSRRQGSVISISDTHFMAASEYGEIIEVKEGRIIWKMIKRNTSVDGRAIPKAMRLDADHPVVLRIEES